MAVRTNNTVLERHYGTLRLRQILPKVKKNKDALTLMHARMCAHTHIYHISKIHKLHYVGNSDILKTKTLPRN